MTRLFEIILWAIGLGLITNILVNSYHWMKGNKFSLRLRYLGELRDKQDMEEAWRSVWQTENINFQNEHEFFNIFSTVIDSSLNPQKPNLIIAGKLLGDFNNFVQNRSINFLLQWDGLLKLTLEWHLRVWEKDYEYLGKEDRLQEWSMFNDLSRTIDSIFRQIEARALDTRAPYTFFKTLDRHSKKYEKKSISTQYYIEPLFGAFYEIYFEKIHGSPDRHNIWNHYFPNEWKVTKGNLEDQENIIAGISMNKFIEWASAKIWHASEEKDFELDEVSRNLFPEVDPIIWAKILIFILSPYGDDRLRSVIERPWNFGFMGRTKVYAPSQKGHIKAQYQTEEKNTFELSYYLYDNQFSKMNLESYIESLEQLSYEKESTEERKRVILINIFTEMLAFLMENEPTGKTVGQA